jgi:formyl-CoA transferase
MSGPLTGLTVLEFSQIYAGPFAGMLLADMGADVIKVEPPWGEPWRYIEEFAPGENRAFIALNRGKRSLPLDLTTPEGRRIVHRLAESADVVVINARSDVPAALGIDYGTLSSINPEIVYCDNSAL